MQPIVIKRHQAELCSCLFLWNVRIASVGCEPFLVWPPSYLLNEGLMVFTFICPWNLSSSWHIYNAVIFAATRWCCLVANKSTTAAKVQHSQSKYRCVSMREIRKICSTSVLKLKNWNVLAHCKLKPISTYTISYSKTVNGTLHFSKSHAFTPLNFHNNFLQSKSSQITCKLLVGSVSCIK